ncbi:Alcohol dehydrogenase 2 [Cyphellophora attinorum]|uniref:Alcohol dehydrogenase 2 n=1 Tax=Cyphellophora attinorum TaxID=1664694 RepID=A0A0N1HE80_9EURO|nr:Alcohol dehydrogenase 2 [Phialophora attinorum]KPI43033.1 Alcohol dehydrogenase 2 [Phialophora attinorum]
MAVPKRQWAAVRIGNPSDEARASLEEIDVELPGPDEILIKINWTGVCGSDDALFHGAWKTVGVDVTPEHKGIHGHEGAGDVVAVGENMREKWKIGDRAGIKWFWSVCRRLDCEFCSNGLDEVHCPRQHISGLTKPGTFQQYALSDGKYATRIPDAVPDEEAAPIMCGGITAYVGVKRANLRAGQWIVCIGGGGGLGHLASPKEALTRSLGAEVFIDFEQTPDVGAEVKRVTEYGAHGAVITAYTPAAYESAPNVLRPRGTFVVVGLPHNSKLLAGAYPNTMVLGRLTMVGSCTGSMKDAEEALDLTARGLVHPKLLRGKLRDLDAMFDKMHKGQLAGRAVLKVSDD